MERIPSTLGSDEEIPDISQRQNKTRRRSSVFFQNASLPQDPVPSKRSKTQSEEHEKYAFLSKRMEKLSSELDSWNEERKSIKLKCKSLQEKRKLVSATGREFDLSILSKEEQKFIKSAPNYNKILEDCQKFRKAATRMALTQLKCEVNKKKLLEILEKKNKEATKRLFQLLD